MQKATFQGKTYLHPMIAERQREVAVSIKALRMMQEHHGNPYFCFKCVPLAEEKEWHAKAEEIVPPVIVEPEPELAAAYQRIDELEATLDRVREAICEEHDPVTDWTGNSESTLLAIDAVLSREVVS